MYRYMFCIFLFLSTFAIAASKKDSLNQDKALIEKETMFNAGTWKLYMEKCDGKAQKRLIRELQRLSWPDFRNYTRGAAKYASGWSSGSCDGGETQKGRNFYNWVIDELIILTGNKTTLIPAPKESIEDVDDLDNVEEKLKKLKSLFDKNLITEEEYTEKKKEILDLI